MIDKETQGLIADAWDEVQIAFLDAHLAILKLRDVMQDLEEILGNLTQDWRKLPF